MDTDLALPRPKIWATECAVVCALVELHVSPDLDDCVGYGVGLIRVALRQIVVEALVVLLSSVQVYGQEKAQESKYVPAPAGREVHVWMDGRMDT